MSTKVTFVLNKPFESLSTVPHCPEHVTTRSPLYSSFTLASPPQIGHWIFSPLFRASLRSAARTGMAPRLAEYLPFHTPSIATDYL